MQGKGCVHEKESLGVCMSAGVLRPGCLTSHRPACYQIWNIYLTSQAMCPVRVSFSFSYREDPEWVGVLVITDEFNPSSGEAQLLDTRGLHKHHVWFEFKGEDMLYFLGCVRKQRKSDWMYKEWAKRQMNPISVLVKSQQLWVCMVRQGPENSA